MAFLTQDLNITDGIKNSIKYMVKSVYTKVGSHLYKGRRICELNCEDEGSINVKAKFGGVVSKISIKVGDHVYLGDTLIEVKACLHPTILGNICCDCGIVFEEKTDDPSEESRSEKLVSMLHSIPDLKVSKEEAARVGNEDIKHLLDKRKLVLLVDLDQTLIHTTNDNIPPKLKDVFHFQLIVNGPWYHTRLRPYTKEFLKNISNFYELHICTFGVREYAHSIASFLDPDHKLFGDRILSRNECLDPMSKKANLSSLFPCGDNLVCIIDDRSDVWNFAPNVVQVMPYHFFQHTGDINAPPELQKKENDNISMGFDFSNLEELTSAKEGRKSEWNLEKKKEKYQDAEEDSSASSENERKDKECIEGSSENDESSQPIQETEETPEPEEISVKVSMEEKSSNGDEEKIEGQKCGDDCEEKIGQKCDEEKIEGQKCGDECEEKTEGQKCGDECEEKTEEQKCGDECEEKIEGQKCGDECEEKIEGQKCGDECEEDDVVTIKSTDSETLDVEDNDDYLLYLEDILKKLHLHFYENYNPGSYKRDCVLPDIKQIVPSIRKTVLDGCHLVLSGIVPQSTSLTDSKVYHIATSLGASVSEKITGKTDQENDHPNSNGTTTHVIAANLHTEKVHQAKKQKHIKIVTPNWLWCCAERWELVDERLFRLTGESEKSIIRNPPMHCFINMNNPSPKDLIRSSNSVSRKDMTTSDFREQNIFESLNPGCFSVSRKDMTTSDFREQSIFESLNPLAYMSNDETKSMEDEVDDLLDSDEEEEDNLEFRTEEQESDSEENSHLENSVREFDDDEDEDDDDDGNDSRRKRKRILEDEYDDDDDEEDELPSIRFRQGGSLPSDENEGDSGDEDMNAYGDILERELMRD